MKTRLIPYSDIPILELTEAVTTIQDALDIISGSYEHNTTNVLLRAEQLPAEFFELQTLFAGEFIQKLVNYQLHIAGIFNESLVLSSRFREYIAEARQGQYFKVFATEDEAMLWLRSISDIKTC